MPAVLALGAWLKNSACLLADGRPHWSAPHGDLDSAEACRALAASAEALLRRADALGSPVVALAHDLHPDFFSTQLALQLAERLGVPALGVQHHQAHIAAVLAEHGVDEPVVGLALDGVGLGTDGQAWGGELLWLDGAQWRRLGHLWPLALPGGDRAAREPWRMAAAAWHGLGEGAQTAARLQPSVGAALAAGVQQLLERGLHCPQTSSAGRWFDAAAGALGLCLYQSHEAEAALALQAAAERWLARHPAPAAPTTQPLPVDAQGRLDLRPLFARVCACPEGVDAAAALFHCGLADALAQWAGQAARAQRVRRVVLGGGCFFNPILRGRVQAALAAQGLQVLQAGSRGCGDAALAWGQAWVAARQLQVLATDEETRACA